MTVTLESLQASGERLRADLMATNMALQCVLTSMPPEAQRQALKALAQLSVMQEQFAAQQATPAAQASMQPVREAVERIYQGLQGAHKMRMSKLGEQPDQS